MNQRNPAIRRILADVRELKLHPSSRYHAQPLEDNMFEWHFTIRGPDDTPFAGGIYHGRILLPSDYPMKPPNIVFMTKNGRFEVGTKICLSISAYHEETWQPAWGVRTMLEAIISFFPTEGAGAIGALDWSAAERKRLAEESKKYCCPLCGEVAALLSEPEAEEKTDPTIAKEIAQIRMTKPVSHSARFNTSGVVNDVETHTDMIQEEIQLIPDNCLTVDCMEKLTEDLTDLAESHLDADPDADGTIQDMLDVDTITKKAIQPKMPQNDNMVTKEEDKIIGNNDQSTQSENLAQAPIVEETSPASETSIPETNGLRQRHANNQPPVQQPEVVVPRPEVQADQPPQDHPHPPAAHRPELVDVVIDGLISLTIGAMIYVGSGIVMRHM